MFNGFVDIFIMGMNNLLLLIRIALLLLLWLILTYKTCCTLDRSFSLTIFIIYETIDGNYSRLSKDIKISIFQMIKLIRYIYYSSNLICGGLLRYYQRWWNLYSVVVSRWLGRDWWYTTENVPINTEDRFMGRREKKSWFNNQTQPSR